MAEYTVVEKDKEYVPAWDSNDDKPESEQIKCTLRYLTTSQRSKCWKITADNSVDPDYEKLMVNGLISIENLIVNGEAVTTARQLGAVPGFDALYMEIATEILIMNARDDLKN